MIVDLLVQVSVGLFVVAIVVSYFRARLFRCPECGFRSDVDHLVEATGEAPYCAYCGTHMNYVGRKLDAWRAKLTGRELAVRCPAGEVEREGIGQQLLGWLRWSG